VVSSAAVVLTAQSPAPADPVMQAMKDEIERARKLTITSLETPYFIHFGLDESETFEVSATLGGVLSRRHDRFRSPEVQVRVGDYAFDNTNYTGGGSAGSRYDLGRFPLENSYPVLRRYFWLEADSAYKGAVEAVSRKRAALRNMTQSEKPGLTRFALCPRCLRSSPPFATPRSTWKPATAATPWSTPRAPK
jgi:hypothetical protein